MSNFFSGKSGHCLYGFLDLMPPFLARSRYISMIMFNVKKVHGRRSVVSTACVTTSGTSCTGSANRCGCYPSTRRASHIQFILYLCHSLHGKYPLEVSGELGSA